MDTLFADHSKISVLDIDGDGRLDLFATLFADSRESRVYALPVAIRPAAPAVDRDPGRRGSAVGRPQPGDRRLRRLRPRPAHGGRALQRLIRLRQQSLPRGLRLSPARAGDRSELVGAHAGRPGRDVRGPGRGRRRRRAVGHRRPRRQPGLRRTARARSHQLGGRAPPCAAAGRLRRPRGRLRSLRRPAPAGARTVRRSGARARAGRFLPARATRFRDRWADISCVQAA